MGLLAFIRAVFRRPANLNDGPVVGGKPLWQQFQRIGGGIGPEEVSWIIREADAGQPGRLVDLFNEARQKDAHLQSVCSTHEGAVALCPISFGEAEPGARRKDKKAIELCERIVEEFENWPTLIEHLTASYLTGHATSVIDWRKTSDGLLLPFRAKPLHQRDFIFNEQGELRFARSPGDIIGVDLLADNPGRIVQIRRRINGDVPVREGLIRVLVWAALLRNWTLRDWIALGEIGWKPWRLAKYIKGASQRDKDEALTALELVGSTGIGLFPETVMPQIEWPKGGAPGMGGSGTHLQLFDALGREMSKAALGGTTSVESGPNGTRSDTEVRDKLRLDIRERAAVVIAAHLRAQLFLVAVKVNLGESARVPMPWFQTDDATDIVAFATMVEKLTKANVRLPQKWVRDEVGSPPPEEGEEVTGSGVDPNAEPENEDQDEPAAEAA
jgi:phage gp29-like protein